MIRKRFFQPLVLFVFFLALIPACNNEGEKTTAQTSETNDSTQTTTITETNTAVDSALGTEPTVVEQPVTTNPETVKEKPAAVTTVPAKPVKATTEVEKPKAETAKPPAQATPVTTPVKDPPPPPAPINEPVIEKPAPVTKPAAAPTQEAWAVPAKAKATANPIPSDKESLATGKSLYLKHCASCHGKSGAGDGTKAAQLKTQLASFRTATFQNQTDGSLFYKIWEGREDMPSYKKKIPDRDEVWSVVNYLRTLK